MAAPTATVTPASGQTYRRFRQSYGLLAEFDTTADALHAAAMVRDAGFRRWDVYTPFPVHGMDEAMGLKNLPGGLVLLLRRLDRLHHRAC